MGQSLLTRSYFLMLALEFTNKSADSAVNHFTKSPHSRSSVVAFYSDVKSGKSSNGDLGDFKAVSKIIKLTKLFIVRSKQYFTYDFYLLSNVTELARYHVVSYAAPRPKPHHTV